MNRSALRYRNIDCAVRLLDAIFGLAFGLVKLALWVCVLGLMVGLWVLVMK